MPQTDPKPTCFRYALAYKGIPFTTSWLQFRALSESLKALGAKPTSTLPNGQGKYTVPAIRDDSTGEIITESIIIAQHLDDTHPTSPKLLPPGSVERIKEFDQAWHGQFQPALGPLTVIPIYDTLDPEDRKFFRETQESILKTTLEDFFPEDKHPEYLDGLVKVMNSLAKDFPSNGPFFLGETFSYADCIVGGHLTFAKKMLKAAEWRVIAEADGGRWAKVLEYCEGLKGSL